MPSVSKGNQNNKNISNKLAYLDNIRDSEENIQEFVPEMDNYTNDVKIEEFVPTTNTENPYVQQVKQEEFCQYSQPIQKNGVNNINKINFEDNVDEFKKIKNVPNAKYLNHYPQQTANTPVINTESNLSQNPISYPYAQQNISNVNINGYEQPQQPIMQQNSSYDFAAQTTNEVPQHFIPAQQTVPTMPSTINNIPPESNTKKAKKEKKQKKNKKEKVVVNNEPQIAFDPNLSAVEIRKLKNNLALKHVSYPPMSTRFKAGLIDFIIDAFIYIYLFISFIYPKYQSFLGGLRVTGGTYFDLFKMLLPSLLPYFLFCFAGYFFFHVLIVFLLKGQSIGKRICGIRIAMDKIDLTDIPSFIIILKRELWGKFLANLTFGIGYLIAIKDEPYKKGIPDRICDTHVVWGNYVSY